MELLHPKSFAHPMHEERSAPGASVVQAATVTQPGPSWVCGIIVILCCFVLLLQCGDFHALSWTHRSCSMLWVVVVVVVDAPLRPVPSSPNRYSRDRGRTRSFLTDVESGRVQERCMWADQIRWGCLCSVEEAGGTTAPRSCRRSGDFGIMIPVSQPPTEEAHHDGYDGGTDGRLHDRIGKMENPARQESATLLG